MSEMIEVRTENLSEAALDYAAAQVAGVPFFRMGAGWPGNSEVNEAARLGPVIIMDLMNKLRFEAGSCFVAWSPSTEWSQAGVLVERLEVTIYAARHMWKKADGWGAQIYIANHPLILRGETPLIAACRAIVASKLGDTVKIPKELVHQ